MLTKNTFKHNERLINIAVIGFRCVELKAFSQHCKNKKGASLPSVFFYANPDFHLLLEHHFCLFFPYA